MDDTATRDLIERVLDFWFGAPGTPEHGRRRDVWFQTDADFDAAVREGFAHQAARAAAGDLDHLASTPRGALALVILLDQFPRNLHRGRTESFAADARARRVATAAPVVR